MEKRERLADKGFGTTLERYSWSQTIKDITVTIPVAAGIKSRNLDCRIQPNHLYVLIRGEDKPIIDGQTFQRIKVDNSVWTLEGEGSNRILRLELEKNEDECWWPFVVEGEPCIDVTKIDPPPVMLDALDESTRSQVEKMMYDQNQKEKNLSTSDEQRKEAILKQFMSQHPEMDFSNAVIE